MSLARLSVDDLKVVEMALFDSTPCASIRLTRPARSTLCWQSTTPLMRAVRRHCHSMRRSATATAPVSTHHASFTLHLLQRRSRRALVSVNVPVAAAATHRVAARSQQATDGCGQCVEVSRSYKAQWLRFLRDVALGDLRGYAWMGGSTQTTRFLGFHNRVLPMLINGLRRSTSRLFGGVMIATK